MKEGYRLTQNAKLLSKAIPFSAEEIMAKWDDKTYVKKLIDKYWFLTDDVLDEDVMHPLEGYLFPDTYFITDNEPTIEGVTEMMLDRMETVLSERRDAIEASGFSVNEFLSWHQLYAKKVGAILKKPVTLPVYLLHGWMRTWVWAAM